MYENNRIWEFIFLNAFVFGFQYIGCIFYGLMYENNRIWGFIFGYYLGICIELGKDSNILFNDVKIALSYFFIIICYVMLRVISRFLSIVFFFHYVFHYSLWLLISLSADNTREGTINEGTISSPFPHFRVRGIAPKWAAKL